MHSRHYRRRTRRNRSSRTERGQALLELVIICAAVLMPLLIGLPLIGKYLDMMRATEQAARYVAFEASMRDSESGWKTDEQLAAEVAERVLGSATSTIRSTGAAQGAESGRNLLWTDHSGRPMLSSESGAVSVDSSILSLNAIPAALQQDSLGLSRTNFYTGGVTLKMAAVPGFAPFDGLALQTTRSYALLTDPWTARGPEAIRARILDSAFTYPIAQVKALIDPLGVVPVLTFDPSFEAGEHGWDAVPDDRLVERH